jgi:hypothetical protein
MDKRRRFNKGRMEVERRIQRMRQREVKVYDK